MIQLIPWIFEGLDNARYAEFKTSTHFGRTVGVIAPPENVNEV